MAKKQTEGEIAKKTCEKTQNHFAIMRRNIDRLMEERKMTVKQLAEKSGLNMDTLRTFIYDKDAKDCRLSTALALASVFDLTIEEMIMDESTEDEITENIRLYRGLPPGSKSLIDWHIRDQAFQHEEHDRTRPISIMKPICSVTGNLKRNYEYEKIDSSILHEELYHKVFFGIKIPCNHYAPKFFKGDILLIANDREAIGEEYTIVVIEENILITKKVVEDGVEKYYGMRDGVLHAKSLESVRTVGYIAKVIKEDKVKYYNK